jgi:integrase
MVAADYDAAAHLLQRRAEGDYSSDTRPAQFPAFERQSKAVSPWQLFEQWQSERKPAPATLTRWRATFKDLTAKHPNAAEIDEDAARAWIKSLIGPERSALTVRTSWLTPSKLLFGWAVDQKLIPRNPFVQIKVTIPRSVRLREKAFTPQEATTILRAALAEDWHKNLAAAARRWLPWLCAYSGCRIGEAAQLRGCDVRQIDGVWAMVLTPDAGRNKTKQARTVPLHEHLVGQGFLTEPSRKSAANMHAAR